MSRLLTAAFLLLAAPAFAQDADAKPKLVLLPFATLGIDVSPRIGVKAAGMLTTELKSSEKFEIIEIKPPPADEGADALAAAKKLVDEAKELRSKKKFRLADEALQKALATWRTSAPAVSDVGEVVDATALLSAVQFNTGRDDEGAKSLHAALALAPDRELPLAQTSALFGKVVADARKALREGPKSSISVESSPPNASVTVDGVTLGNAPLLVREVPPGQHYWRAQLPTGELVGGVIEVVAGKAAPLKAASQNKDPDSRLLSALAQNKIDAEALAAAKDAGKAVGADVVLFGAISQQGKGLALDLFAYTVASNEVRRLPRAGFDTELLQAGMEFFNVASEMSKGANAGEAVKAPASVSTGLVAWAKQTDVRYGQAPGRDLAAEALENDSGSGPGKDEPRKPLERRVPLKKK